MDRVIQTIGALLLIGVLLMGILTYANVTGISSILNYIKAGIDSLTGWLVPKNYSVSIAPASDLATVTGNKVVFETDTAGTYQVASVSISTDKPLKVVIYASSNVSVTFAASISPTDAVVYREVEQVGANTYMLILRVYPIADQGSAVVTISVTVTTVPVHVEVSVSNATYI